MTARHFHVVAFDGDDSVAVVPDIWLKGSNQCWWPPYKGLHRLHKAVQQEEVPANDWKFYTCRVLYSGPFIEAEKKLRKAEETSDLQSEEENIPAKRKKFARRRLAESESSCDEEEPALPTTPPALPTTPPALPTPPPALQMPPSVTVIRQSQVPPTPPQVLQAASSQDPHFSRSQEARDMRIFTLLEVMNETLKNNNRLLRLLLSQRMGGAEAAAPPELPEGVVFPLKNVEEMEALDTKLEDETAASSAVKYLADLGGRDIQDTVARIMRTIMDTNLARQYNFKGLKGKKRLEGLKITGIIFRCLRMNPVTRQASLKDMEAAITKWLGGARDRNGGRKARMHGTPAAMAPSDTSAPGSPSTED